MKLDIYRIAKWVSRKIATFIKRIAWKTFKQEPNFIKYILSKFKKNIPEDIDIEDLKPKKDSKDSAIYEDILLKAIKNNNQKIIALTGGYGSGKSTIIESFLEHNPVYKRFVIKVSAAEFTQSNNPKPSNNENISGIIAPIEKKLAQQIAHQIQNYKIPFSKFKTKNINRYILTGAIITINTLLSFIVLLANYTQQIYPFKEILNDNIINLITHTIFFFNAPFFTIFVVPAAFFNILNSSLKLKIFSTEIEKTSNIESFLDKNIDELLYLLKSGGKNIIIFEDIDRYRDDVSLSIFEKLRDINTLYHEKYPKDNLNFIFLIREDVFNNPEDMTKYFDIIIPVVPFLSLLKIEPEIRNRINISVDLSDKPLLNMAIFRNSFFLSDMRTLISICNNFNIFRQHLEMSEDEDLAKLFTLTVYKVLFPDDYIKLTKGEGVLYEIVEKELPKKRKEQITEQEKTVNESQKNIDNIKNEPANNIYELQADYLHPEKTSSYRFLSVGEGKTPEKMGKAKFLEYVQTNTDLQIRAYEYEQSANQYSSSYNYSIIQHIDNVIDIEDDNFKNRKELLDKKSELEDLEYSHLSESIKLSSLKNSPFSILSLNAEDFYEMAESIKSEKYSPDKIQKISNFISMAVNSDLVGPDYPQYLSSINYSESEVHLFIRNVLSRGEPQKDKIFSKTQISEILNLLIEDDLKSNSILNYSIFDFLLSFDIPREQIKYFFENDSSFIYDFIKYRNYEKNDSKLKKIFTKWIIYSKESLVDYLSRSTVIAPWTHEKDFIALKILELIDINSTSSKLSQINNVFKTYFEDNPFFLEDADMTLNFRKNIKLINPQIKDISLIKNASIIKRIYIEDYYTTSVENAIIFCRDIAKTNFSYKNIKNNDKLIDFYKKLTSSKSNIKTFIESDAFYRAEHLANTFEILIDFSDINILKTVLSKITPKMIQDIDFEAIYLDNSQEAFENFFQSIISIEDNYISNEIKMTIHAEIMEFMSWDKNMDFWDSLSQRESVDSILTDINNKTSISIINNRYNEKLANYLQKEDKIGKISPPPHKNKIVLYRKRKNR